MTNDGSSGSSPEEAESSSISDDAEDPSTELRLRTRRKRGLPDTIADEQAIIRVWEVVEDEKRSQDDD